LAQDENQMLENMLRTLLQELVVSSFSTIIFSWYAYILVHLYMCGFLFLFSGFQAAAAQSGEQIMQYGQLIDDDDDDDDIHGQIPHLLG